MRRRSRAADEVVDTLREQIDRLRGERDDRARELRNFKEQNNSLQRRLDETADRLVEFERKRMQTKTISPDAEAGPRPVDRETLELNVQKSRPLEADAPTEVVETLAAQLDGTDPGHEKPIAEIAGIPADLAERLALIGAKTNLQFLQKAGSPTHRGAMAKSMRLDAAELLGYVHRADLLRTGMRDEDVDQLAKAGVGSVRSLASADAAALVDRMTQAPGAGGGKAPDTAAVARWIGAAQTLAPMVVC